MRAILEGMSVRMYQHKIYSAEPWALDEVSTRNCVHCHADGKGMFVICAKGYSLTERRKNYPYSHTYVASHPVFISPCVNCFDFSNHWT